MKPFKENSLKKFVESCPEIFGHQSQFVTFECHHTKNKENGLQSDSIAGCIRYRKENGDVLSSPPFFVKLTPTTGFIQEALLFQFANEIFFYAHLLPYFAHLEPSILQLFPKFYSSYTQTHQQCTEAAILLQDLGAAHYRNPPKLSFLDYAHLSLMVRSLGRFHGCSYLAKQQDPRSFHAYAVSLNPINFFLLEKYPGFITKCANRGLSKLAQHDEYKSFVPTIQQLLDNADQILVKVFKNEGRNPWAVVCHGDYWSGNVMFKYDQGQPVDMKMVDPAMSAYASPGLDLALVLYMNSDQETRDLYWERLVDDYYQGLSSVPVNNLPSREDIVNELKLNAFYAYLIASFFSPKVLAKDQQMASFRQFLPSQFDECQHFLDLPCHVQVEIILQLGGEVGTQVLVDILIDMLKRGFIHQ